ncbi:uncharacterized protein LOC127585955 [Pristis pectinata]|uniref:uncharacterized protein LOC127585955 n=1 Tax=Pristis pectinata TaxID=685728 RepID=UPI00223E4D49|nr:uncharacterized protein LOC127585955 [Pristis pectinata]
MEGTGPLRVGLTVLVLLCGGVSAGSHFLRFVLTSTTPIPGFPQVVGVGSVDGVQFMRYDSDQKLVPRDQRMRESEGAEMWMRKLELGGARDMLLNEFMSFIMSQTNQSSGIHVLQRIFGCDLREDGTSSSFVQYGWDGEDLLKFDKGRKVWVSSVPWGMSVKNRCNVQVVRIQRWKDFLETECVEWLRRYVEYGERELRVVPPQVTFTPSAHTPHLSCWATGFHPSSIEVTLWRDGTILHEAHSSGLLPNHDGTHQIRKWVQVDPDDPGQFSCRVEHSGLEDPIVLVYVRGTHSRLPLILGLLVALIALTIAVGAVHRWRAGVKRNYNPTPTSDGAGSSAGSTASETCADGNELDCDLETSATEEEQDMEGTGPLRVVLTVLVLLCGGVSAASHFLRFFLTFTIEIPDFPHFLAVGYVDGVKFMTYDSDRELVARDQWMGESEGAKWWMRKLELVKGREIALKQFTSFIMFQTNHSGGIHTLQQIFGCDLREDGTTSGFSKYSWDGQDLMSFDKGHMFWVTSLPWAQNIKNQCSPDSVRIQRWKNFLERECVEWLRRYVEYGERELRVVPPQVTFTPSAHTPHLSCWATGFHPPSIEVTLWRDGTILNEAHSSGLLPNHDGTHQIRKWVQVDPDDPGQFSCRVEHSGLEDPVVLVYVWGTHSRLPLILGLLVALIALTIAVGAVYRWRAGVKRNYNPTPTSDGAGSSAGSTTSE